MRLEHHAALCPVIGQQVLGDRLSEVDGDATDAHHAGVGNIEALERPQQGGLPRSGRPDHRRRRSSRNGEGQTRHLIVAEMTW